VTSSCAIARLAEVFADEAFVSAVRRALSWTHLKTLTYIDDPIKRDFYVELARAERWSTRQLQERIDSMLFERSAISRKPDPYVLDFLGLNDHYPREGSGGCHPARDGAVSSRPWC
jgi:hypothetical protein